MLDLLESGDNSDIVFRCGWRGGEEIKAHRNILSARSSVFRAMFESESGEEEKGVISVEDTESEVLIQLLQYLYAGKVEPEEDEKPKYKKYLSIAKVDFTDWEELQEHFRSTGKYDETENYMVLMGLANKYGLVELSEFISLKLLGTLNENNALELGICGETHNSPLLLNSSAKFIADNAIDPRWDGFEIYPQLMRATLAHVFKNGSNDQVESAQSTLERDMLSLLESGDNSDIVLQCEGEEIKAHRSILSARSPVLRAVLELDQPCEISVEDTEPATLRQMVKYLYTGKVEQDFTDNRELMILANKYGLVELLDFTSLKLVETLNKDNALELGILGEIHNSTGLLNGSANFFLKKMSISDVWKQQPEMAKYPKLVLAIILASQEGGEELGNVSEFTWFTSGAPSQWNDRIDVLEFEVSQKVILVGIGLYGSEGRNKVEIQYYHFGRWYHGGEKTYFSEGGEAHTRLRTRELELYPGRNYQIEVKRSWPEEGEVWRGEMAREETKVKEMMVTVRNNSCNAYSGHIAALYLKPYSYSDSD